MANDPQQDQQVANRPGQTAPVLIPSGLQPDAAQAATPSAFSEWDKLAIKQNEPIPPGWKNLVSDTGHVAMLTPDGSQTGDVPLPNVQKAREAGHHIAIPMTAPPPDEQKGWIPYHRVADALGAGFKYAHEKLATAGDELSNLTSVGLLPAFLKTPRGKEINEQFNQEIHDIIYNPEKRLSTLVGMVQPGAGESGLALEAAVKDAATAVEQGKGFSFNPRTGKSPTSGYMVEMKPESRKVLPEGATAEDIKKFTEENKETLAKHPEMHVGGYGKELNVSGRFGNQEAAEAVAKKLDQESIYDVKNDSLILTGGKNTQREFPEYPEADRIADLQKSHVQVPSERTAGVHDTAIKAAGAVPGGIQKGDPELEIPDYAMFHDPQSGSSLMLPVDKITPEAVSRELEKSRAQYAAAEARKAGTITTAEVITGKRATSNADLERAAVQEYGVTDEPRKAGFVLQDGRALDFSNGGKVRTLDHGDISEILPRTGDDAVPYNVNPRQHFVDHTGAVRLMLVPGGRGAVFAEGSLDHGISDSQLSFLGRSMEDHPTKELTIDLRNAKGTVGSASGMAEDREDVERIYRDALRDVAGAPTSILTAERQSPLKEPYKIEITDPTGTMHSETIQAFSPQDARKIVTKQFPDASLYRLESFGERAPSTEYSVPTGKHLSMPEQPGRSEEDTIHHELGHAMVGQNEGIPQEGMLRHTHADLPRGRVRAAVRWDSSDLYSAGQVKPDKMPNLIRTYMGGIAADEVRGLPRAANHNFDPSRSGSDGQSALRTLQEAGYDTPRALEIMHQAIDANKEYLTHPAVRSVIEENAPFREPDLSRQYHFSPERLNNMHSEIQRRMTSEQAIESYNRATYGENIAGRAADVAGGEGAGAPSAGQGVPAEKEIKRRH